MIKPDLRELYLRYSWGVNLILLALLALVCASGVNSYIAGKLREGGTGSSLKIVSASLGGQDYRAPVSAIISRDLFKAAETMDTGMGAGDTSDLLKETRLRLKLLGIAYFGEGDPYNLATIKNLKNQEINVYIKGNQVSEDATLDKVEMDRVILARADGSKEELGLEDDKGMSRSGPREASRGRGPGERTFSQHHRSPPRRAGPDLGDKIKKVGENDYIIQEGAIQEALSNLNSIITQARVIPYFKGKGEDRRVEGFRIYRIKSGSLFEFLGLQNGDVIKSINGEYMNNVEKGIQLLQSLRDEKSFNLEIERRRQDVQLNYDVE